MAAFFHWLGILIGAVILGVLAHLVVLVLKKVAPPAAQGLYRATRTPAAYDWLPSLIGFTGLFLATGILQHWVGWPRCCWPGWGGTCTKPIPAPREPQRPQVGTTR